MLEFPAKSPLHGKSREGEGLSGWRYYCVRTSDPKLHHHHHLYISCITVLVPRQKGGKTCKILYMISPEFETYAMQMVIKHDCDINWIRNKGQRGSIRSLECFTASHHSRLLMVWGGKSPNELFSFMLFEFLGDRRSLSLNVRAPLDGKYSVGQTRAP